MWLYYVVYVRFSIRFLIGWLANLRGSLSIRGSLSKQLIGMIGGGVEVDSL